MRKVQQTKGPAPKKPAVAFANQAKARENIVAKLDIVLRALKTCTDADNCTQHLRGLPETVRQFNRWEPADAHGARLNANAQITLKRIPGLYDSVRSAVGQIRSSLSVAPVKTKADRVATLRRANVLHRTLREIAEREMIKARSACLLKQSELEIIEARLGSALEELRSVREELEASNARCAALTTSLSKVVPLRTR